MKWYAIFRGKCPGVYDNWAACNDQVLNYEENSYKGYNTKEEAMEAYVRFMQSQKPGLELHVPPAESNAIVQEPKVGRNIQVKDGIIGLLVVLVVVQFVIIFT